MKNTTFNLPPSLIARAKAYAAENGTSMTAMIRDHLEAITGTKDVSASDNPLFAYARGHVTREEALSSLGLRDHAELLVALGDLGLVPPRPAPNVVENEAALFERIWKAS